LPIEFAANRTAPAPLESKYNLRGTIESTTIGAFRMIPMMRKIKDSYAVFATMAQIQTDRFRSVLTSGRDEPAFNDKFFEMIDRRRGELGKLQQTIFFLQLPTFMYLVLVLAGIDVNLSLFGIAAGKNLREALVLVSSGLGLWATLISSQKTTLENMLRAKNEKLAKGDKEKREFLNAGYGLQPFVFSPPINPQWRLRLAHFLMGIILIASVILMMLAVLDVALAVHVMTLLEVYRHPNFSPPATGLVIAFVILADVISVSWIALASGVLPYKSQERTTGLVKLADTDPEAAKKVVSAIIEKHSKKSLVMRLLTRPVIPKKL
jgi:hypothetical protein